MAKTADVKNSKKADTDKTVKKQNKKVPKNLKKKLSPEEMENMKIIGFKINPNKVLVWFLILSFLGYGFYSTFQYFNQVDSISLSEFVQDVKEGKVDKVEVEPSKLTVNYVDGSEPKEARKEESANIYEILSDAGVDTTELDSTIEIVDLSQQQLIAGIINLVVPTLILAMVIIFVFRQVRGAQDGIMGFGRSKAKRYAKGKQNVRFKDVGGMKEAKKELEEIVDFLKHPKKYKKLGARTPKGALLVGPSGTGKTLLARAVAGEANAPFYSMAGSEFMEMLVGVGASRVRDLFQNAKKNSPAIIFIDEIDAIGRTRGMGSAGGHDEREQTLNQILVEMDGFSQTDNVIVLAATNRGDLLDPALTRPGRFDRRVTVGLPDIEERTRILKIHAENKPFDKNVNWDRAAKRTVGFSGADLENMLNEAAIQAAREDQKEIKWDDIEEAAMKVKLGPEKKRLQNDYERQMTAFHEGGHAVLAHFLPNADPVHRVSIVSRGRALGFTLTPPEQDKYQQTKSELLEDIAVLLGGRTAELMIFNELTGGASSDIERATRIARAMVMDYGMSALGPINFNPQYEGGWSRAYAEPVKISNEKAALVDKEVEKIIKQGQKLAEDVLTKHKQQLNDIAKELLANETVDGDDFEKIMGAPKVKAEEKVVELK